MARKTKEEAAETRISILMAALDLFAEKGYSRTTLLNVARRIGMTRGAIYWHFENKEALLAVLIDHVYALKEQAVASLVPDVRTIDDLRNIFIHYARVVENDPVIRKFEFFMNYQMEWSEELLVETQKKMAELRPNPMENFRDYFDHTEIANRFRADTDVDQLVLTLGSMWIGACKLYLGRHFPSVEFGQCADNEIEMLAGMSFERTVEGGFDLILSGFLKEESENE